MPTYEDGNILKLWVTPIWTAVIHCNTKVTYRDVLWLLFQAITLEILTGDLQKSRDMVSLAQVLI